MKTILGTNKFWQYFDTIPLLNLSKAGSGKSQWILLSKTAGSPDAIDMYVQGYRFNKDTAKKKPGHMVSGQENGC